MSTVEELRDEMYETISTIRPLVTKEVDAAKAEIEEEIMGLQAQIHNIASTLDALVKSVSALEQRLH